MSQGATGGKGAPAPPNFNQAAQATANSSAQAVGAQTQNNRPDQTNAFGATTSWGVGPDGRPTQTQSLSRDLQPGASELEKQITGGWSTPLDNGATARTNAENAIYSRETSRLDPQWQQDQSALTAQLANQGLDPGSQAGDAATGNFNRAKNDAYSSALQQAIMGGGQEASRQQQMDLTSRLAPEQALSGLSGLTAQPSFMAAGAAQPADFLGAARDQYGGDLQKYGIDQQGKNSAMGGLANLGGNLGAAALLGPAGPAAFKIGRGA